MALMRSILSVFIVFFAGWTIAIQFSVLSSLNLKYAIYLGTGLIILSLAMYALIAFKDKVIESTVINNLPGKETTIGTSTQHLSHLKLFIIITTPFTICISWMLFWTLLTLVLVHSFLSKKTLTHYSEYEYIKSIKRVEVLAFITVVIFSVLIALMVSRSDLDDSFYVAVAAFHSSHPMHSILSSDPMLGEPSLPLIFPSYRFASFEMLIGALGYLFHWPAMDFYYIYLLPFWVFLAITAFFLLARQYTARYWCVAGVITFLLIILLGEMPRSSANFSFVRLFQGKAVYCSVIVPAIFYYASRFFSPTGTRTDLFILYCCPVAAIGLTNFGMLAAPLAFITAIAMNLYLYGFNKKKAALIVIALCIPVPYLITVALESNSSIIMDYAVESPEVIFISIFGKSQVYLVSFLILAGSILVKDKKLASFIIVPSLIFFGFYLNPLVTPLLAKYLTTPPVYWRTIWTFPVLSVLALIIIVLFSPKLRIGISRLQKTLLFSVFTGLIIYSLPQNTLRAANNDGQFSFASWKIKSQHLLVSQQSIQAYPNKGVLLAPEEISGVISRFENHPPLIGTRFFYFDMLKTPETANSEKWEYRKLLFSFVAASPTEPEKLKTALRDMNISVIVKQSYVQNPSEVNFLHDLGYHLVRTESGYNIWQLK
ncbi:DUF6077 domain-containing protein [Atlantibacter sp.]|uniref:DUF6077 domain-containing protein n=1 Tax=Atlantibacter sp. TaxID=1903473 RepID=UPI0028A95385|nr:DUF6077 domain-containing protein [Atlantibacter sp.]